MLTEDRIGELWDEAVGEGWELNHRHVVDFVRRVERETIEELRFRLADLDVRGDVTARLEHR